MATEFRENAISNFPRDVLPTKIGEAEKYWKVCRFTKRVIWGHIGLQLCKPRRQSVQGNQGPFFIARSSSVTYKHIYIYIYIYILVRTRAVHARSMFDSVLLATGIGDLDLLKRLWVSLISLGPVASFSSVRSSAPARPIGLERPFECPGEAERAQVRALFFRGLMRFRSGLKQLITSSAPAGPSRFERLIRAAQWGRASSSG